MFVIFFANLVGLKTFLHLLYITFRLELFWSLYILKPNFIISLKQLNYFDLDDILKLDMFKIKPIPPSR
jgi:hypothetical protein